MGLCGFYKGLTCSRSLCSKGLVCLLLLVPTSGYSGGFCLLMAENYYEQLYCEIKAQGKGKRLPSFYDFQKNNEVTQAFLLKRPGAKLGIDVVQLKRTSKSEQPNRSYFHPQAKELPSIAVAAHTLQTAAPVEGISRENTLGQCVFKSREIFCAGVRYQLMGNLANKKLVQGVLEHSNRMNIPVYVGEPSDQVALERYLSHAYGQYIEKMLEIGLGGSTFSYAKFVYLYKDVTDKNINFSGRFETMYRYLKKDKRRMAVPSKSQAPTQLQSQDCYPLKKLLVCSFDGANWLFSSS